MVMKCISRVKITCPGYKLKETPGKPLCMSVLPSLPNMKLGIYVKKYKIVQGNYVHFS